MIVVVVCCRERRRRRLENGDNANDGGNQAGVNSSGAASRDQPMRAKL